MKTTIRILFAVIFFTGFSVLSAFSQVSISSDNSLPDNSAMLDVKSSTKGVLFPKVALQATNLPAPVTSPATGLYVYNTATTAAGPNSVTPGNYYWDGASWIPVSMPKGTSAGNMLYWNGTQWISVAVGSSGQILTLNNNVPTWGEIQPPAVTTTAASAITQTMATSGGNVTSNGGMPVTARGVCWSTTANPTIDDSHTTDGSGTGIFTSNMTELLGNTPYFIRAYATSSLGTTYGLQLFFTTAQFTIGQSYGGGKIFYIDPTGQSGLIAATSNQNNGTGWGCSGTSINGTSTSMGTGQANTTAITNGCPSPGIAAQICNDLVLNGYSDWYLPSKDELNRMYQNRNSIGNFNDLVFWSSSEYDASHAWSQDFEPIYGHGAQSYITKNNNYGVRAIRAFPATGTQPHVQTLFPNYNLFTQTTAVVSGVVDVNLGSPVTMKGICWSTLPDPTITDSHSHEGSGTGSYTSTLTGLSPNSTTYYVRAYATTSEGTFYGNQWTIGTLPFAIGQYYQGGTIFYLDATGQHGLIAATTDQSANIQWYNGSFVSTVAVSDGLYAGHTNTERIINSQGSGLYAALYCTNYQGGGFGDWYLPSKYELNLMYMNKDQVGLNSWYYWSSTEAGQTTAWAQEFDSGTQITFNKIGYTPPDFYMFHVRAIRAF